MLSTFFFVVALAAWAAATHQILTGMIVVRLVDDGRIVKQWRYRG